MPEEVHITNFGSNIFGMVGPGQNVIYNYNEKLETGHLRNLSEVGGGGEVVYQHWLFGSG